MERIIRNEHGQEAKHNFRGTKIWRTQMLIAVIVALLPASTALAALSSLQPRSPLAYVLPGEFLMGDRENNIFVHADPVHPVTLTRPYFIGRTVVTVADFAAFVTATGYVTDAEATGDLDVAPGPAWWADPGFRQDEDWPVTCVSFRDALRYANWRSRREGLMPTYRFLGAHVAWDRQADGYRLPTEAEWEFAARCGGACSIPAAEEPDIIGPVHQYPPNELGVFGMHDGALEWCWDGYQPFEAAPMTDPVGIDPDNRRVVRGLGTTRREWALDDFFSSSVGFRLARNAPALPDSGSRAELLGLLAEQDAVGRAVRRAFTESVLADSLMLADHRGREKIRKIGAAVAGTGLVALVLGAALVESSLPEDADQDVPEPRRVRTGSTIVMIGAGLGLVGFLIFSSGDGELDREEALERARSILGEPDLASGDRAIGLALRW